MRNLVIGALVALGLISCTEDPKQMSWQLMQSVSLENVNPIGITATSEGIWLSDGDRNRLVLVNEAGQILKTLDSLERPMHITAMEDKLFIPEYGRDAVATAVGGNLTRKQLKDSLDAPAGVWVQNDEMAIADFYNHRILYSKDGVAWLSIGREGKAEGDFYYPTDVQFTENEIWVADAYNHRVQVFSKSGEFLKVIGADQKMNAATGLFVSDTEVFVTDFENDRVLIFDHEGVLKQVLSENIHKPTDMLVHEGRLYVVNYRDGLMSIFEWKETPEKEEGHGDDHRDHDH